MCIFKINKNRETEMKIHKIAIPLMVYLLLSFVFVLIGCKEKSVNPQKDDSFFSKELTFFDFDDAMGELEDASFDKKMGFKNHFKDPNFPKGGFFGRGGRDGKPDRRGDRLKEIFRMLQLTEAQIVELKTFFPPYKDCMAPAVEQFREAAAIYIRAANIERDAIIAQVRAGEITREEARDLLHELNRETRNLIANDPECAAAREAMCDCKEALFNSISSILTEDQLTIWNRWIESHPGGCE